VALPETWSKTKRWTVWAAQEGDLERLLVLAQKQFEPLLAGYVEEETKYERQALRQTNLG